MSDFSFRLDGRGHPERLLVLLHGYGATQHDIAPIAARADPQGRFYTLSPRGRIDVAGGGASWYDSTTRGGPTPTRSQRRSMAWTA